MHINESAGGTFAIGEIEAACRVMRHAEHSLGWRITFRGKSAAVSGDTAPNPGLIKLSRGADILICECSYPEGTRTEMHMTPSLAGQAAQEAGVKTLVLTHLYPATEATDVKGIAAERFEGEIIVAHDLLHLAL
jgi:ribonuclease BN (tRNA processing enzyme)